MRNSIVSLLNNFSDVLDVSVVSVYTGSLSKGQILRDF